jgi:hypothetical protein
MTRKINMRKLTSNRFGLFLVGVMVAAFMVAPISALAQNDPTSAQYNPPIPDPGSGVAGGAAGGAESAGGGGLNSNIGSLPFTGLDLIIVAGVAFVLTGTGFALRRLSAPRGSRV